MHTFGIDRASVVKIEEIEDHLQLHYLFQGHERVDEWGGIEDLFGHSNLRLLITVIW